MSWVAVTQFNIGQGRTDAILIPFLLSSSHVAIKVTDTKRRKWRKSGDLLQQFEGDIRGRNIFVPFSQQTAIDMQTAFGDYYLRFRPVSYHQGLFVEIWKWSVFSPIRINCGGNAYIDSLGNSWLADTYRVSGGSYSRGNTVSGSADPELYRSESFSFIYQIPLENGSYQVKLHFCDFDTNERIFSIVINGQTVLANYSINDDVGVGVAVIKSFNVSSTSGFISISSINVSGALSKLNAIEVLSG